MENFRDIKKESLLYSFLKSGIYMDKLLLHLECLDDSFYLEQQETSKIFELSFLQKQFMEDLTFLHKTIQRKFIRLKKYELMEIGIKYADFYNSLIFKMINSLFSLLMQEIKKNNISVTDHFKILYGEYLENATVIYSKE